MAKSIVRAYYSTSNEFEVDFDINQVHQWWIKWDTLYVIHQEGDEAVEYEPTWEAVCEYKRPTETEVETYDVETA